VKKAVKRLDLNKQTIRVLASDDLAEVGGGWIRPPITWSCPQPPPPSSNCPKTAS
jgi:hypothetical protein